MRIARSLQHLTPMYANIGKVYHAKINNFGDIYTLSDNVKDHGDRGVDLGFKPDSAEVSRASI